MLASYQIMRSIPKKSISQTASKYPRFFTVIHCPKNACFLHIMFLTLYSHISFSKGTFKLATWAGTPVAVKIFYEGAADENKV